MTEGPAQEPRRPQDPSQDPSRDPAEDAPPAPESPEELARHLVDDVRSLEERN